jgi:hypothetical protein
MLDYRSGQRQDKRYIRLGLRRTSDREVIKDARVTTSGPAAVAPFSLVVVNSLGSGASLAQVVGVERAGHGCEGVGSEDTGVRSQGRTSGGHFSDGL